jgi:uncharacterized cofD-like protein
MSPNGPGGCAAPRKVVALGGGTGLPAVLRGFKPYVERGEMAELTAVVTMTDDGGSSGRLRRTRNLPPPGDLRNCLVALSSEEDLLAGLFQHRYAGSEDVGGHTAGNLILAALAEMTGSFMKAVEMASRVLRTAGRILPATLDDVVLEAEMQDGSTLVGETAIASSGRRIRRVRLRPGAARTTPGVLEALHDADLIVLGPGSLFTSVLPNVVVRGVSQALREARAPVVLVGNLVSERGEAAGLDLMDHIEVIEEHTGGRCIDALLCHEGAIDEEVLARYKAEGATSLQWTGRARDGLVVVHRNLLAPGPTLRHDPVAAATGLIESWGRVVASPQHSGTR